MKDLQVFLEAVRQMGGAKGFVSLDQVAANPITLKNFIDTYSALQAPANSIQIERQPFATRCKLMSFLAFLCFQNFERDCKDKNFLGIFSRVQGSLDALIDEAGRINQTPAHFNAVLLLTNLALLDGKLLDLQHQKIQLEEALATLRSIKGLKGGNRLDQKFYEARILIDLAKTNKDLCDYSAAEARLDQATAILQSLNGDYYSREIRTAVDGLSQAITRALRQQSAATSSLRLRRTVSLYGALDRLGDQAGAGAPSLLSGRLNQPQGLSAIAEAEVVLGEEDEEDEGAAADDVGAVDDAGVGVRFSSAGPAD